MSLPQLGVTVYECGLCGYQLLVESDTKIAFVPQPWGAKQGVVCASTRDCERRERDGVAGARSRDLGTKLAFSTLFPGRELAE